MRELIKCIEQLSYRHQKWQVFSDFVEMSAISISNSVDWNHRQKREETYLDIAKRYQKEELELFPKMFAYLVQLLEHEAVTSGPSDILGKLFHELELHNKYKGQFFTPGHICDFMGEITISDYDADIEKNGFIKMCEPCVGSGAMVLGFAKAIKRNNYTYQTQLVVEATDVDIKCVHMAYIQLSLYGIPAVIIHGNSLSMEEWSRWYTPVYMLDGWPMKLKFHDLIDDVKFKVDDVNENIIKKEPEQVESIEPEQEITLPGKRVNAEQLSLFEL